jgi:hypothetical protein
MDILTLGKIKKIDDKVDVVVVDVDLKIAQLELDTQASIAGGSSSVTTAITTLETSVNTAIGNINVNDVTGDHTVSGNQDTVGTVTAAAFVGDGTALTGVNPFPDYSSLNSDSFLMSGPAGVLFWQETDFKLRIVYTQGYMMGGYQGGTPWRNVNRTVHSTDITTNLGDVLTRTGGYASGGFGDLDCFLYGSGNTLGASSNVEGFHMFSETGYAAADMTTSRDDSGSFQNQEGTFGYIYGAGAGSQVDRHSYTSNTFTNMYNGENSNHQNSDQWGDDQHGFRSKGSEKMNFATEAWSSFPNQVGAQTHSKTLPSKHGRMYIENNGNSTTGAQVVKYNTATFSGSNTSNFKAGSGGETNFEIGQEHGYGLGDCGSHGCQSNHSYKAYYHTDSHTVLGSAGEIKGHPGASSGGCGSRGA